MSEAADAASNNISAILLFWLWWALLSALETAMRMRGHGGSMRSGEAASDADAEGDRFAGIVRLDPGFGVGAFIDGARRAYETVVQAYAAGDIETLEPLLSPEVLEAFSAACAGRAERGETLELTFVGIDRVDVRTVEVTDDAMEVTLGFGAQMIRALRAADGAIIDGDASAVVEVAESWTFARPVPVAGNAWTIVATGE